MSGMGSHQSGRALKDEWLTPPEVIEALAPFDLDPCAAHNQPWDTAAEQFTIFDNGLAREWKGLVWCNPPYGRATGVWLDRLAHHGNGIALIFARTETEMFWRQVWCRADCLLFLNGRLHFHHVDGRRASANAGAPSVLAAYGGEATQRLHRAHRLQKIKGTIVDNWRVAQ